MRIHNSVFDIIVISGVLLSNLTRVNFRRSGQEEVPVTNQLKTTSVTSEKESNSSEASNNPEEVQKPDEYFNENERFKLKSSSPINPIITESIKKETETGNETPRSLLTKPVSQKGERS